MFISLPVIFQDIDEEEAELTGKKPKKIKDELMVNIDHVCAFNENSGGNTTNLRLTNGEVHEVLMKYDLFKAMILALTEKQDIFISTDN